MSVVKRLILLICSLAVFGCSRIARLQNHQSPQSSQGSPNPAQLADSSTHTLTSWAWIGGSNLVNQSGSAMVPGSRGYPAHWFVDGEEYIFGGIGFDAQGVPGSLNDFWKFDGKNWIFLSGTMNAGDPGSCSSQGTFSSTNLPQSRFDGASWVGSDGALYLFGGMHTRNATATGVSEAVFNDLWKYDRNKNQWAWIAGSCNAGGVYGVTTPPAVPGSRIGTANWMDASSHFWIFGGSGFGTVGNKNDGVLDDIWTFDGANWTYVGGDTGYTKALELSPTPDPGVRHRAATWSDSQGDLWLFGGSNNAFIFGDLWKLDGRNHTWSVITSAKSNSSGSYGTIKVPSSSNLPGARDRAASWTDSKGNFWLYGGYGYATSGVAGVLNDLWKYDGTNWTWMDGSSSENPKGTYGTGADQPGARMGATIWVDENGVTHVFGGFGFDSENHYGWLSDHWIFSNDPVNTSFPSSPSLANCVDNASLPSDPTLLKPANIEYLGAQRVPSGYADGGVAVAYNPSSDSLFMSNSPSASTNANGAGEISLVSPVIAGAVSGLPASSSLQPISNITGTLIQTAFPGVGHYELGGLLYARGELLWNAFSIYDVSGINYPSHGISNIDLANPQPQGLWYLGATWPGGNSGYMADVPTIWQSQFGYPYLTGLSFYSSGEFNGLGPDAFGYNPWQSGALPASNAILSTSTFLAYGGVSLLHQYACTTLNNNEANAVSGMAFPQTPSGLSAVIYLATNANFPGYFYGEPFQFPAPTTGGGKGGVGSPSQGVFLFYDPKDLLKVKSGALVSSSLKPYATMDLTPYLYAYLNPRLGGMAYDAARGRLFVVEMRVDGMNPVVHVFQIH